MLYGNELIGLYVDKTEGYYYSLRIFMFCFTVSGNELNGHSFEIQLFNLNLGFNIRLGL